jgi:hypothetical protein
MKKCIKLTLWFLCFVGTQSLFGQETLARKVGICTNNTVNKGKYKLLSVGRGIELQVNIEIKSKYRTDENYVAIVKEFKERYCQATQLRITYFESKKQWLILDPFKLEATPLAIYYFGSNTSEKEGIVVYKVVNGKVETRNLKLE